MMPWLWCNFGRDFLDPLSGLELLGGRGVFFLPRHCFGFSLAQARLLLVWCAESAHIPGPSQSSRQGEEIKITSVNNL